MTMKTDKKRNDRLVRIADRVLHNYETLFSRDSEGNVLHRINPSFNGQIAAFSVMIAMTGLKPAMCIYYQDSDRTNVSRRNIILVLAKMISEDKPENQFASAKDLYNAVITSRDNDFNNLKTEILECLIALKLVVRTYIND